jgi:hypothetical protein
MNVKLALHTSVIEAMSDEQKVHLHWYVKAKIYQILILGYLIT